VASLTVIAGITFWLGMALVLAWSLVSKADELASLVYTHIWMNQLVGLGAAAFVVAYMVWVSLKRRSVKIQGWKLELPGFRLSLAQILIGAGDVCAGAGVLFVLLPGGHGLSFETFVAVYIFAVMLGVASHAPGGLGVFEATILLALSSYPREPVLGALLLYRLCYYLVPFVFALALLGAYEIRNRIRSSQLSFESDDGEVPAEAELGGR
jgi:glycosyltransferase 2 family protein